MFAVTFVMTHYILIYRILHCNAFVRMILPLSTAAIKSACTRDIAQKFAVSLHISDIIFARYSSSATCLGDKVINVIYKVKLNVQSLFIVFPDLCVLYNIMQTKRARFYTSKR